MSVRSNAARSLGPDVVFEATARMRGFFHSIERADSVEAVVDAAMQINPERS